MQSFLCLEESRNEPCVGTSVLRMQGKCAPSPAPHPRKCRFAHTGKACVAVQILCWNFRDRTNYKAIALKTPAGEILSVTAILRQWSSRTGAMNVFSILCNFEQTVDWRCWNDISEQTSGKWLFS